MKELEKLKKEIKLLEGKINPYKVTVNNFLLEYKYKEYNQLKKKLCIK